MEVAGAGEFADVLDLAGGEGDAVALEELETVHVSGAVAGGDDGAAFDAPGGGGVVQQWGGGEADVVDVQAGGTDGVAEGLGQSGGGGAVVAAGDDAGHVGGGTASGCGGSAEGGEPRVIVDPDVGAVGRPEWSPDGESIRYTFETPTRPADLDVMSMASGETRRLTAERGRLESERRNLVDAVAKGNGDASPVLMERVAELDEEVGAIARRIEQVRGELVALELGAIDADELQQALEDLEPIWAELFPKERARILTLLLERVEFDAAEGEVAITFRPGAPRGITSKEATA